MKLFLLSLGLVFVIEGIPYFLSPEKMKGFLSQVLQLPDTHLRTLGIVSIITGMAICYVTSLFLQ